MTILRTLVLSGVLAASATGAFADDNSARIQRGIYDAQRPAVALQEGRASASTAPVERERRHTAGTASANTNANGPRTQDPIYFQQANGRDND